MAGFSNLSGWTALSVSGLNGLPNNQSWQSATIIPPTGPRPFYMDVRVILGSFNPTVLGMPFYVLQQVDDLVPLFRDITAGAFERNIIVTTGTSQKLDYLQRVPCPIVPFRIAISNPNPATALAATGNSVSYQTYSEA
jgi:hypothetical protein